MQKAKRSNPYPFTYRVEVRDTRGYYRPWKTLGYRLVAENHARCLLDAPDALLIQERRADGSIVDEARSRNGVRVAMLNPMGRTKAIVWAGRPE